MEFGRSLVGPVMGRFLALHGATVVKVESRRSLDVSRLMGPYGKEERTPDTGGTFANLNANKFGITLDLKHERGPELARRLMLWSDVVIENMGLTTLDDLGLGYASLAAISHQLNMTTRTLRRHLEKEGTSYKSLLDDTKRRDAIRLLDNHQLTIQRTAELLGYQDPANFTRAFKQWTGQAPSDYDRARQ